MMNRSYVVAGGELITWKSRGEEGDAYSLFENVTQPGYAGPPPHRHLNQDESFYVLEGDFCFEMEGRVVRGGPGTFVHVPRGRIHTFKNTGTCLGRMLVTVGPAGDFEAFVEESGEPTIAKEPPALAGPPPADIVQRVVAAAGRHGMEIPPPPNGAH